MALRRLTGVKSYSVFFACSDGEHDWVLLDRHTSPPLWRCLRCGAYGFMRRKGTAHRNGKVQAYRCSTSECSRVAKVKSKVRVNGGAYLWACCADHATGPKFADDAMAVAEQRQKDETRWEERKARK